MSEVLFATHTASSLCTLPLNSSSCIVMMLSRCVQMLVFMLPMEADEEAGSFRGRRSHPAHDVAASILETSRPIQQSLVGITFRSTAFCWE